MVENTHEFHIQSAGDPSFLVVANDKEKADQLLQSLPPEVPRHGGFAMEEEHGDGATAAAAHEQISAVGESGRAIDMGRGMDMFGDGDGGDDY